MLFSHKKSLRGYYWEINEFDEKKVKQIQLKYNFSENLSKLIVIRGIDIDRVDEFINPRIKNMLGDPSTLKDMNKGINIICDAILNNEIIGIYGDYDVDGITSTALFKNYLDMIGIKSVPYIPNRNKEGYGLNIDALKKIKNKNVNLVVTVDCGISNVSVCESAKEIGLRIVITDHHLGNIKMPDVEAIINPNRIDESDNKYKILSAVGVVFLILTCLNKKLDDIGFFKKNNIKKPNLLLFLDLVALGTVCDVMPLVGLNRAFVLQGLKLIEQRKNLGIKSIIDTAKIEEEIIDVYHIGFIIGPRLNATGRVGESKLSCEILYIKKEIEAKKLALELEKYNIERQRMEADMLKDVIGILDEKNEENKTKNIIFVENDSWHEGLVGILASRLKDKYDKPVFVATKLSDKYKVSCRSVKGVNIGNAILSAMTENMLIDGGGHEMAGGFNLELSNIDSVKKFMEGKLNEDVKNYINNKKKNIDLIMECNSLTINLLKELDKLKPFGSGNVRPKIVIRNACIIRDFIVGKNNDNLRLIISDKSVGHKNYISAMFFKLKKEDEFRKFLTKGKIVSLYGEASVNKYKNKESIQFLIEDVMLE
ncbi:MAG: single-stranded-DNA-specific exonuclease RecJ [Rickettsiales bacterium]|jgi:single-stranded-DNA-specific exonuclease|nr:single-stranded-DNA-specific exonuclease RecJ [Rickettsiales bacterium]